MPRFFSPPNQLTMLRVLLTPVFVALYLSPDATFRLWSIVVFVAGMLTDWYDGWVARRWGYITKWGSHIDPMADKIFISAAFFSFVFRDLVPAWTVWVIVTRDIGVTFLRSYSEIRGIPFLTSFSAKVKTFAQFLALCYILLASVGSTSLPEGSWGQEAATNIYSLPAMYWLMTVIAIFTLVTGVQYIYVNRSHILKAYGARTSTSDPA